MYNFTYIYIYVCILHKVSLYLLNILDVASMIEIDSNKVNHMFRSPDNEGIIKKKIPMSVAPMSRYTKRAYLRLCPQKRRKQEFGP